MIRFSDFVTPEGTHTITVEVTDAGGLVYTEALQIAIANVNEAPSGTDKTITAIEDTDYVFTSADFGFTDVESPADNFLNIIIASAPTNGILYVDANGGLKLRNDSISGSPIYLYNSVFITVMDPVIEAGIIKNGYHGSV